MSEQLNHTHSEIVYVDFSKASMSISQLKVQIRNTNNVVWVTAWIECIPRLGLGNLDFVTFTGVLHHLKSPLKGLNTINNSQVEY